MPKTTATQKTATMMKKSHPNENPHPHVQGFVSCGENVPLKRVIVPVIFRSRSVRKRPLSIVILLSTDRTALFSGRRKDCYHQ